MGIANSERLLKGHIPQLLSLWRGGGGSGPMTNGEMTRASDSLFSLQRGLTGERTLAGTGYMQDSNLLGAYLLYYWPVSYLQVSLALSERMDVLSSLPDGIRILDLGCGPGAASMALCDLLPGRKKQVTLADASGKAMKIAAKMLNTGDVTVTERIVDFEHDLPDPSWGAFDVVIANHLLNELWVGKANALQSRVDFLERWTASLASDGLLFIAEPALLKTSREELAVRDELTGRGFSVLSPCMGDGPCPAFAAGDGHTCHGEIGWKPIEPIASLAMGSHLDRESVKMAYFFFRKGKIQRKSVPDGMLRARVVSDGMLNKGGRLRYLLCDGARRFPFSARKDDPRAKAQGFLGLRRYDLVEITHPEIRKSGEEVSYGVGPETYIRLVSRIAR